MKQLVYVSVTARLEDPRDLEDLLFVSRRLNRQVDVTGVLLYYPGGFMQCLEGPSPAVDATYARILRDARHQNVQLVLDQPIETRAFGMWDMACARLSASWWLELATAEWHLRQVELERAVGSPGLDLLRRRWREVEAA